MNTGSKAKMEGVQRKRSIESPLEGMLAAGIPRDFAISRTMKKLITSAMDIGVGMALPRYEFLEPKRA